MLFGIEAREPHTGYGYIRQGAALNGAGTWTSSSAVSLIGRANFTRILTFMVQFPARSPSWIEGMSWLVEARLPGRQSRVRVSRRHIMQSS